MFEFLGVIIFGAAFLSLKNTSKVPDSIPIKLVKILSAVGISWLLTFTFCTVSGDTCQKPESAIVLPFIYLGALLLSTLLTIYWVAESQIGKLLYGGLTILLGFILT